MRTLLQADGAETAARGCGVLELVRETTFSPGDFTLRADGACRLNPELARRVVLVSGW